MRISALTLVARQVVKRKQLLWGQMTGNKGRVRESGLRLKIQESFRKELNILGLADSVRFVGCGENRRLDQSKECTGWAEMRVKVKKDDLKC